MNNIISIRELADYHKQNVRNFTYKIQALNKKHPGLIVKLGNKTSKLYVSLIELNKLCPELLPTNSIVNELQTEDNKQIKNLTKRVKMLEDKLEAVLDLLKTISE